MMSTFSATEERKMEALSPAALDVLRAQLREISPGQEVDGTRRPRKQYPDHRRLCHRAAISFRLAPEYGLGMPDGAVALGQIRMVRLIYGFQKSPQGVMKPRASLAFLCPGLDIPPRGQGPGSGRIVWQIAPNPYDPSRKGRLWDLCSVEEGKSRRRRP